MTETQGGDRIGRPITVRRSGIWTDRRKTEREVI